MQKLFNILYLLYALIPNEVSQKLFNILCLLYALIPNEVSQKLLITTTLLKVVVYIVLQQKLDYLISLYTPDKTSGTLVACDICRISTHDITDYLVYRVVPLFCKSFIYSCYNIFNLYYLVFLYFKILCIVYFLHKGNCPPFLFTFKIYIYILIYPVKKNNIIF